MEAKELRISNLVYDTKGNVNTVCVETFIKFNKQIEPISLTEEWLKKFKFKKSNDEIFYKGAGMYNSFMLFKIFESQRFKMIIEGFVIYLDYVHQLQNLYFALTGKELKIKQNILYTDYQNLEKSKNGYNFENLR